MKKWIIRLGVAGVVIVIAAVGALLFFLNDIVKSGVETVGPQLTKGQMRLSKANISPFSGSAQLTGLFVGNPEGWKTDSAIKVGDVKVALNVGSALSDTVIIDSISIDGPEITFEGALNGSNIGKILENVEAAAGSGSKPSADSPTTSTSSKKFKVKDIRITAAKVHLSASALMPKPMTLTLGDLHLQNIGTANEGVTAAELTRDIIKPLLAMITKAVAESAGNVGQQVKDLGKGTTDQLNKTTKGIKDLFNKTP